MSSNTSGSSSGLSWVERNRACANCKKKKIKCYDSLVAQSDMCLTCSVYLLDCIYESEELKKRSLAKGYVEVLQDRIILLENVLSKICPNTTLLEKICARHDEDVRPKPSSEPSIPRSLCRVEPEELLRRICRMGIGLEDRPYMKYPTQTTPMQMKQKIRGEEWRFYEGPGSETSKLIGTIAESNKGKAEVDTRQGLMTSRRSYIWLRSHSPWESKVRKHPPARYIFPPQDLMAELVDAYFEHTNLLSPLLHRPSFDKSLAEGLHLRDDAFGGVVLLVCAVGSRHIQVLDDRVLLDGVDSPYSAGWKWFKQVEVVKTNMLTPPNLYEVQMYALAAYFLRGTSKPNEAWTIAGIGIRVAQDMGIHQLRVSLDKLTVEDELQKRAFWVLVSIDQTSSIVLGRPCAIANNEMDLDMPVECDDEYWENEDPKKRFRQPEGKPSTISAFNHQLKLNKIMLFALNSIYHVKSKMWNLVLDDWQVHVVEELDSAMNKWLYTVPECLRWDPHRKDDTFYKLSVMLMGWYYYVQILVHRPFIPTPDKPSSYPFPSLAICTNAARSCTNLVDAYRKRGYQIPTPFTLFAFTSGIVLSLNRWGSKRSKASPSDTRGVDEIYKCLDLLKAAEDRWHGAGRAWDILHGLIIVQERPKTDDISEVVSKYNPVPASSQGAQIGETSVLPRYTVPFRRPSNVSTPSDSDSLRPWPQSYHTGGTSMPESHTGSTSTSLHAFQPPKTSTLPEYYTPLETRNTSYPSSVPLYTALSSTVAYDSNDSQLSYSYPGSEALNGTTHEPPLSAMDCDSMNVWMNIPTEIGFDDWESIFGGFNWNETIH